MTGLLFINNQNVDWFINGYIAENYVAYEVKKTECILRDRYNNFCSITLRNKENSISKVLFESRNNFRREYILKRPIDFENPRERILYEYVKSEISNLSKVERF